MEAFRDHPSASDALRRDAEEMLAYVRQRIADYQPSYPVNLQGAASWPMSPLGMRLPVYPHS